MAAHAHRRTAISLTPTERQSYVWWWIRRSGLSREQLQQIAAGMWSDRPGDASVSSPPSSSSHSSIRI